jgi:hypothetical protein
VIYYVNKKIHFSGHKRIENKLLRKVKGILRGWCENERTSKSTIRSEEVQKDCANTSDNQVVSIGSVLRTVSLVRDR